MCDHNYSILDIHSLLKADLKTIVLDFQFDNDFNLNITFI